jgi:hypothetical protein
LQTTLTDAPIRSEMKRRPSKSWLLIAILGSLLVHVALFAWFQTTYWRYRALPSEEELILRKFKLERVEINPKWMEPKLSIPSEQIATTPTPDASSLTPTAETRSFAQLLAETPAAPTMPSGTAPIPQDKPTPALSESDQPQLSLQPNTQQELKILREQQFKKASKSSAAGRPSLSNPGSPVVPKSGSPEAGLPTETKVGPSQGEQDGATTFTGSSRLENFFGPKGGLPPTPETSLEKPKAQDTAALVPQGLLKDKPTTKQKYDSLNPFLNVELFTYETTPTVGHFLIRISAKPNQQLTIIPKDVYFVLDVSSSIGKARLATYRQTVYEAISKLNPQDRFKILAFRGKLLPFREDWTAAANPPLAEIQTWLNDLNSGGVTDFYDGLKPLTLHKTPKGRTSLAFVLSDGLPTTGLRDSTQIISELSESNNQQTSIFTLSNGRDVNNFLLDLLAYSNQGWLRYTPEPADSVESFSELIQQTRNPLFLDLKCRFAGTSGEDVYPQNLPHLYQDSPLLLFGRYRPGQTEPITLQILGESLNSTKELLVQLPIPKTPNGPETLPSTWARQRIYHLLSQMTQSRARQETILNEVQTISKEYHVPTPYFDAR